MLSEVSNDLQLVIDCAIETTATVRIAEGIQINVSTPLQIRDGVRIVGPQRNPTIFTCNRNRILRIRSVVFWRAFLKSCCAERRQMCYYAICALWIALLDVEAVLLKLRRVK